MKILFIEDDDEKRKKIIEYISECCTKNIDIVEKRSYHSGLIELVSENVYDMVLLDMSMPNFDITIEDPEGGTPESFAGRKLLEQMKFRFINYPTVIITQYNAFGEYVDKLSLNELKQELSDKFSPIYRATVYYSSSESNWKEELKEEINKILLKETND